MDVLQLDVSGRPQSWISAREAAVIYAVDGVAWTLGDPQLVLRGGIQRTTGVQSRIEVHPIIAVRGAVPQRAWRQVPALTNSQALRPRPLCVRLLWQAVRGRPPHARAHPPDLTGWAGQLDELHHRLPRLQTATRARACPRRRT